MFHINKHNISCRHVILMVQLGAFVLSLSPLQMCPPLSILIYCLAVFPSPFLLLSYYCSYLSRTKHWLWEGIPCVTETMFAILYISAMIDGIRFDSNSTLFSWLLAVYLLNAFLCTLGYLMYYAVNHVYHRA